MAKYIISVFIGAVLGSGITAGWFYFIPAQPYVLDIKSIVDSERENVLKQVEEKKISEEEAGYTIRSFFEDFEDVLKEYREEQKVIMVKDAVLSGGKDITDEFRKRLNK